MEKMINGFPLSVFQARTWRWQEQDPAFNGYRVSCNVEIQGAIDVSELLEALRRSFAAAEIFRTTFHKVPGLELPLQVISQTPFDNIEVSDLRGVADSAQNQYIANITEQLEGLTFDLIEGPLIMCRLFVLDSSKCQIYIVAHPLVADSASLIYLIRQAAAFFNGENDNASIDEIPQYADFADLHNEMIRNGELNEERNFWSSNSYLSGKLPVPFQKSADFPSSTRKASCVLEEEITKRLLQLESESHLPLGIIVYASLRSLIARLIGQEFPTIGVVSDTRHLMGIEGAFGSFTQILPDRELVDEKQSFINLILATQKSLEQLQLNQGAMALDDKEFTTISFWDYDSAMNFKNDKVRWLIKKLDFRVDPTELQVKLLRSDEGSILLEINYDDEAYSASEITKLLKRWQMLLKNVLAEPHAALIEHNILWEEERDKLIHEFNHSFREFPESCVHTLFYEQARRTPNQPAVRFNDECLSYDELANEVRKLASILIKKGVGKGDCVGILMEPRIEIPVAVLAIFTVGAAYVPLDPDDPPARQAFQLTNSRGKLILTQKHLSPQLSIKETDLIEVALGQPKQAADDINAERDFPVVSPNNAAYIMYTSGSTGQPKGVIIRHRSLVNYLYWAKDRLFTSAVQIIPMVTKLTFDACLKQLLAPLLNGNEVWILSKGTIAQPTKLLETLGKRQNIGLNCVPSLWAAVLEEIKNSQFLPSAETLTGLFLGGEQLREDLVKNTFTALPHLKIYNLYGPTETTATATIAQVIPGEEITIGRPVANTTVYILDNILAPVPVGTPGEIYIGGVGLAAGYIGLPELTEKSFINNPFSADSSSRLYRTGDRGCFMPDGSVKYLGRVDHQIKIRGYRIEIGEIESTLNRIEGVRDCAVIVHSDEVTGDQLIAYVVSTKNLSANNFRNLLKDILPDYMIPTCFINLPELPRLSSNKINRRILSSPEYLKATSETEVVPPITPDEKLVAQVWQDIFGVENIGLKDNFFHLGGHSLLAARMTNKLNQLTGQKLSLREMIRNPTVEAIAQMIEKARAGTLRVNNANCVVPLQASGNRIPIVFIHPVSGTINHYRRLSNLLGSEQQFYAVQSIACDSDVKPHNSVRQMAESYLEQLDSALGITNSYLLAGWSFGGLIAYEMACLSEKRKRRPASLVFVDTGAPTLMRELRKADNPNRSTDIKLLELLGHEYFPDIELPDTTESLSELLNLVRQPTSDSDELLREFNEGDLNRYLSILRVNLDASANYLPTSTVSIPTSLIRARDSVEIWGMAQPDLGWSEFINSEIDVRWTEGDHYTIFSQKHITNLAQIFRRLIDKSEISSK